jgi:hypothetical protein
LTLKAQFENIFYDILKIFRIYIFKKNGLRGHVWLLITWLDLYVSIVIACFFLAFENGLTCSNKWGTIFGKFKNIQLYVWN